MAIYPRATFRRIPRFQTHMTPVRVNLHTAVSSASSLYDFFSPTGRVCSHFYVAQDGTVEQYVDTDYRAAADLQGNPDTISIESWDGYPTTYKTAATVIAWTDAQVAAIRDLLAWIVAEHPTIPAKLATDSKRGPSSHGISWHRLGVPATYAQLALGRSQTGGMLYSRSVGKTCPGNLRIAQIPGLLAPVSGGIGGGTSPVIVPTPPPTKTKSRAWPDVPLLVDGDRGPVTVRAWQTLLASIDRYTGRIDGVWGPLSIRAEQGWLAAIGYYTGRIDGDEGPVTLRALQRFLASKGLYPADPDWIDGRRGPYTVKAEQNYLNDQRKYQ